MARMLLMGKGPGPKNVLVERDDKSKVVVTYRTWKYEYARSELAEKKKQYRTFMGFVKFEPRESEVERDGETITVRNFVLRATGVKEQNIDVRATLWPSHEDFEISEGDAVLVEGAFTVRDGKDKDEEPVKYFNLSVSRILNLGPGDEGVRDDEQPAKKSRKKSDDTAEDGDEPW